MTLSTICSTNLRFSRSRYTGKERDAESGLDYFGARYYASTMGRWMSPDWADKPEAVPYSDLMNPQSLNLYGYVNNNPFSKADPDGHCCFEAEIEEGLTWASETRAGQAVGNAIGAVGIAVGAFVSTHASEIIDANMSAGGVSSSPIMAQASIIWVRLSCALEITAVKALSPHHNRNRVELHREEPFHLLTEILSGVYSQGKSRIEEYCGRKMHNMWN